MTKPQITFLGLGIMGQGMASRLLAAGYPLTLYNRNPARATALIEKGATLAPTPKEAAASADIILSMVADDLASRALWQGPDGALASARPGTLLIESSTLTVDWIHELAAAAKSHSCDLLDAPVTGSKSHAASGELTFLVGGSSDALEKARHVLQAMSREITHLGPTGSGALVKLINNFVCGVQLASLAEAITLIERSPLNRDAALAVLTNGAPGSPLFKNLSLRMTSRDYTPNFLLKLMAKDLQYAIHQAQTKSLDLSTASSALTLFEKAIAAGHAEQDFSSVIEPIRHTTTK